MPIDYKKYPPNWKSEIVPRILDRANHKCELCEVANKSSVYCVKMYLRNEGGKYGWRSVWFSNHNDAMRLKNIGTQPKRVIVVLTVAHLDHDETNHVVDDSRLAALCQYCHLNYDAKEKYRRKVCNDKKHSCDDLIDLLKKATNQRKNE